MKQIPAVGYPQRKGQCSALSLDLTQGYADRIHTVVFEPLLHSAYNNL